MRGFRAPRSGIIAAIGFVVALAMCMVLAIASPEKAMADTAGDTDVLTLGKVAEDTLAPPVVSSSERIGRSNDVAAIADAAGNYNPNDATSALDLAQAASAANIVDLKETDQVGKGSKQAEAEIQAGKINVDGSGTLTSTNSSGVAVSIKPIGDGDGANLVDGSVVSSDQGNATSTVTSATDKGIQTVAILANEDAPKEIPFSYSLPKGAKFEQQTDGSVYVKAPVTAQVAPQSEIERYENAVKSVIGDSTDTVQLTDEQFAELAAIPEEKTKAVTTEQIVSTISTPWAVDANGMSIPTHYKISGNTLTQVVESSTDTAFPVTADPSWWWWVANAASCAMGIGSFAVAASKVSRVLYVARHARPQSALAQLFNRYGWNLVSAILSFVTSGGNPVNINGSLKAAAKAALRNSGALILNALGIGGCWRILSYIIWR